MIVGLCADKGSAGVTTLAAGLALVWPGRRVVLEADPSGADLPFWFQRPGGVPLRSEPSILSLAADARVGLPVEALARYGQDTTLGVPVIAGALSAEAFLPMRALWPQVADQAAAWPGTVIADLGRVQPGHVGLPVMKAATVVLLLARADVAGLFHLRERVRLLSPVLGQPQGPGGRLAAVVLAPPKQRGEAVATVTHMLHADGCPVPVAGSISVDAEGVAALRSGRVDRRLTNSAFYRSVTALFHQLLTGWPQLLHDLDAPPPPGLARPRGPLSRVLTPPRPTGPGQDVRPVVNPPAGTGRSRL